MDDDTYSRYNVLLSKLNALEKMLDEREDRVKERFAAMEKTLTVALAVAEKAVTKAETATERRFESVNEFRETLRDQTATLMPRVEYEVQHRTLELLVRANTNSITTLESRQQGKQQGLSLIGQVALGIVTIVSAAGAVLIALFRH